MPGNYSPFARRAYALPPVRRHKPPAPSKGVGAPAWVLSGAALDLDFAEAMGYNSLDRAKLTPDSILTYTSPSPKLVYGDDGVLGYAPHNLILQSQTFDNASWVKTDTTVSADATVAPNGTATADLLTEGSAGTGQVGQTVSIPSGLAFTVSLSLKRGNTDWLRVQVVNVGDFFRLWVNLNTGAIGAAAAGGSGVYISSSITAEADGWYRVSITGRLPATSASLFVNTSSADNSSTRVSGGTYYLWGAQLNLGSSALTYIPTTTAAVYSLPIDHNPTTFAPLGVLIEEQRTNLFVYSQDTSVANWAVSETTKGNNTATAPDGTNTADKIIESTTATSSHYDAQAATTTAVTHTFSRYVKASGRSWMLIYHPETTSGLLFDLATGVTGGKGAASNLASGGITPVGDGWYRCWITVLATAASNNFRTYPAVDGSSSGTNYTGDGTSGLLVWGAQLEAGAFPTSYIPTVASQVTRAADQVSILTSAFAYNAAAGTMAYTAMLPVGFDADSVPWSLDNGTFSERISANVASATDLQNLVVDNSAAQAAFDVNAGTLTGGVAFNNAMAWATNDVAGVLNGGTVVTDASATLPTVTRLAVGLGVSVYFNGHIKRLTYFPVRKTNAELQALSA